MEIKNPSGRRQEIVDAFVDKGGIKNYKNKARKNSIDVYGMLDEGIRFNKYLHG